MFYGLWRYRNKRCYCGTSRARKTTCIYLYQYYVLYVGTISKKSSGQNFKILPIYSFGSTILVFPPVKANILKFRSEDFLHNSSTHQYYYWPQPFSAVLRAREVPQSEELQYCSVAVRSSWTPPLTLKFLGVYIVDCANICSQFQCTFVPCFGSFINMHKGRTGTQ